LRERVVWRGYQHETRNQPAQTTPHFTPLHATTAMHQTEELRPHGYAGASTNPLHKAHAIRNI
jgi:hypothetical protein